jgi:hypothetical protein
VHTLGSPSSAKSRKFFIRHNKTKENRNAAFTNERMTMYFQASTEGKTISKQSISSLNTSIRQFNGVPATDELGIGTGDKIFKALFAAKHVSLAVAIVVGGTFLAQAVRSVADGARISCGGATHIRAVGS